MSTPPAPAPLAPLPGARPDLPLPRWDSQTLLGAQREAVIEHRGEHYRLRLTAAGKLILTK
ncbi:MAG: hemin uptake protein HemP [Piscinibacter sp.]|uniref:hemin uptake protein HemP n=1 Tax=Piscinibacter TaxID=1114981 RepID=UPI000FDF39D1|nr:MULTISPECIES: hemin uptake protein HemP [Piscinibacter]MCW5667916.1 hemin uptake protein HemP [Piscinibacter sp.]